MTLLQRFPLLLFQPDYATSDLYDSPPLKDAFIVVSLYAGITSFQSSLSAAVATGRVSFILVAFLSTAFLIYVTWFLLTFLFHIIADLLGGLGELHNTFSFVGLAAAPNAALAVVSLVVTIVRLLFFPDDPQLLAAKINLGVSVVGMAWGWPGILCYFGLKNAERLHPLKALFVTSPVFFVFVLFEVLNSNAL